MHNFLKFNLSTYCHPYIFHICSDGTSFLLVLYSKIIKAYVFTIISLIDVTAIISLILQVLTQSYLILQHFHHNIIIFFRSTHCKIHVITE
ncbi:hypothetical protein KFK09_017335 [Dendrobium nobile]|uniref:Uncharacterized protein n=1 Tax=Dendrobium nobile TaxID=94219 RepID=A0A8T3B0Q4_DENNO|nr:hypothetical protein KFK09_017335 [Dendrobium nobile]